MAIFDLVQCQHNNPFYDIVVAGVSALIYHAQVNDPVGNVGGKSNNYLNLPVIYIMKGCCLVRRQSVVSTQWHCNPPLVNLYLLLCTSSAIHLASFPYPPLPVYI